jgi:hypothetical protein
VGPKSKVLTCQIVCLIPRIINYKLANYQLPVTHGSADPKNLKAQEELLWHFVDFCGSKKGLEKTPNFKF